jgi:hypothetical protein
MGLAMLSGKMGLGRPAEWNYKKGRVWLSYKELDFLYTQEDISSQ